jgi:hypothetical protein|tara:strand:+ start:176 stop:400 length:225 start_codon:yes stop_codon:yes gene_type:complete
MLNKTNTKKGESMTTINELADKLVSEFIGNDHLDIKTEISNHDIMFNQDTFQIIDNYGQNKFEDLVIQILNGRA